MSNLKDTQVFTPPWATNEMIDMLGENAKLAADETFFFEPSCGDGQMLKVIFDRTFSALLEKFSDDHEKALAEAVFKFYAIELDPEMLIKARTRMWHSVWEKAKDLNQRTLCQYLLANLLKDKMEVRDFFEAMGKRKGK